MLKSFPWARETYLGNHPYQWLACVGQSKNQKPTRPRGLLIINMQTQMSLIPQEKPSKIVLTALGIIPSFKNNKVLITKGPTGKPLERPLLITKPEYQKKMQAITESFVLQLLSAFRTDSGATLTGCSLRSAIAYGLPEDDAWTHIPEIHIRAELCEPGEEGAQIVIERLS